MFISEALVRGEREIQLDTLQCQYVISLIIVTVGTCLHVAVLLLAVRSNICSTVLLILIDARFTIDSPQIIFPFNVIIYGNVYDALSVIFTPYKELIFYKIIPVGHMSWIYSLQLCMYSYCTVWSRFLVKENFSKFFIIFLASKTLASSCLFVLFIINMFYIIKVYDV